MFTVLLVFFLGDQAHSSEPVQVAIATGPAGGDASLREWSWALRGGGAHLVEWKLDGDSPIPEVDLLIIDDIPLSGAVQLRLEAWVRAGGVLLVAQGPGFEVSAIKGDDTKIDPELLGVIEDGRDPGLRGLYPFLVKSSVVVSPLVAGDGVRLGKAGLGHTVVFKAIDPSEVIANSATIHPSTEGLVIPKPNPTLVLHRLEKGVVFFVGFSPADVASCYPLIEPTAGALDCSGAASAHAMMRWLTANILWEFHHYQLPLFSEAPGDRPHAVILTGDVHNPRSGGPDTVTWPMMQMTERLGAPLSLYIDGAIGLSSPELLKHLHHDGHGVELSTHNLEGKVMLSSKYWFNQLGMLYDLLKSQYLLGIPFYPLDRQSLLSIRSHGWISDRNAWWAYQRAGIGLVFDHVADSLNSATPWRVTPAWFDAAPESRLIVPLFEHSITTAKDNFRLMADRSVDIASLSSAQPEPVRRIIDYASYTRYVERWHRVFGRLSMMGGLTEVWLWHPEGVASHGALSNVQKTVEAFQSEEDVELLRGDVMANWRANRERLSVQTSWTIEGKVESMELNPPSAPLWPMPDGSPESAHTVGYWVLGEAHIPGWSNRMHQDVYGRTITILTHGAFN